MPRLENARYDWDAFAFNAPGSIDIDISKDDRGWSGCAHPTEIELTRGDLVAMLAALDAVEATP